MRKLPFKDLVCTLIILFISLTPFLWLRGNYVILGHDSGLPLSPEPHFLDRLQTWTYRYEAGGDQSFALGGFFIHGLEWIIAQLPLNLSHQQSLQFSIYIFLMGMSMYFFCRNIWQEDSQFLSIIASVFYQINHFVLQGWFIAERTKFSLYIALPLLLLLLYKLFYTKASPLLLGAISALIIFVLNGGGFLPLYASIFLGMGVWSVVALFQRKKFLVNISRLFQYGLSVTLLSLFLQMYWMLPFILYVKNNFSVEVAKAGGTEGVINWVKSISLNTSYLNLLKLQGIQEWYVNVEHPYAKTYFSNTFLKLFPYFFVFVILFTIIKLKQSKQKFLLLSLLLTAFISIFFMAGSHTPFGFVYLWLIKYIPGFIAFRTPYYKFAPAYYLSIAPLIGFFWISFFKTKILKKLPFIIQVFLPISLLVIYFFPFFTVNFFQYTHKLSTKVQIPSYVDEYAKYSNSSSFPYKRVLLLPANSPENSVHYYSWGYWSLASVQSLLDRRSYITPSFGLSLDKKLTLDLYQALRDSDKNWEKLADHLQIDGILIQKDAKPYLYQGVLVDAQSFEPALKNSTRITLDKNFGEWSIYSFKTESDPVVDSYISLLDKSQQFGTTTLISSLYPQGNVFYTDKNMSLTSLKKMSTVIFPECQDCLLQRTQVYFANPNVIITPGSSLDSIGQAFEFFNKEKSQSFPSTTLQYLYIIQASFSRKGLSNARLPIWNMYESALDKYSSLINRSLENFNNNTAENKVLQGYYNNLLFQLSLLQDISNLINTQEEAELFLKNITKVKQLINEVEEKIISTQILHKNVFLADITDAGTYDVYLYGPSLNSYSAIEKKPYKVEVNGDSVEVIPDLENKWQKILTVPLQSGGQKIIVEDNLLDNSIFFTSEIRRQTSNMEGMKVDFGTDPACAVLPIGELSAHRYSVNFEVKSDIGEIEPTFHATYTDDTAPELPYWGIKQKVTDSSWKKIQIPLAGLDKKFYQLKICDVSAKEIRSVFLRNLEVDRAVEPLIGLVSVATPSAISEIPVSISSTQKENTLLSMNLSSTRSGLLKVPLNFSNNWSETRQKSQLFQIDGNLTGIAVEGKNEPQQFILEYRLQKFYLLGWMISIMGLVFSIGIICISFYWQYDQKKYSKN